MNYKPAPQQWTYCNIALFFFYILGNNFKKRRTVWYFTNKAPTTPWNKSTETKTDVVEFKLDCLQQEPVWEGSQFCIEPTFKTAITMYCIFASQNLNTNIDQIQSSRNICITHKQTTKMSICHPIWDKIIRFTKRDDLFLFVYYSAGEGRKFSTHSYWQKPTLDDMGYWRSRLIFCCQYRKMMSQALFHRESELDAGFSLRDSSYFQSSRVALRAIQCYKDN